MRSLVAVAFVALTACGGSTSPPPTAAPETPAPAPSAATCEAGRQTVTLTTTDGVSLEADLHATGEPGGPGAVLLHMIPPHHDRSNYPPSFIEALVKEGITVLNVDRRGAGQSAGVAEEAYEGPKGRLDAEAAVTFLTEGPCAVDRGRIALVGASNGTTTAVDYAVAATADASLPKAAALVFLTGGPYTENQHSLKGHAGALQMPVLFVYSVEERAWSEAQKEQAQPSWSFSIYKDGAHGTKIFGAVPAAEKDVVAFLARELSGV